MPHRLVSLLKTPWQIAREYYHRRPDADFDWSFGDDGVKAAARPHIDELQRSGIVLLPAHFDGARLERLNAAFERAIAGKPDPHTPDALLSEDFIAEDAAFVDAALDELLLEIIAAYYGKKFAIARSNAIRLNPTPALRDGSYQWHHDTRGRQLHLMILLNEVRADGQRMQYLSGSHQRYDTHARAHSHGSRFEKDMREALERDPSVRERIVDVCGPAGTAALFDANGLHSGNRNANGRRDTVTFCYVSYRHFKRVTYRRRHVETLPAQKRRVLDFNPYAQFVD